MKYILWALMIFIFITIKANTYALPALKIGDTLPATQFDEINKITSRAFSDASFSGRLYILDFWSTGCTSCMESFPKMEALQFQFTKQVKIIAVNPWQDNREIGEAFGKYKYMQHYRLTTLPSINGDTAWKQLFPTRTVPHHVWLDSTGKVLYISGGYNTIPQNIQSVLENEPLHMLLKPEQDYFDLKHYSLDHYLHDQFAYQDTYMQARSFYEGEGGSLYGYQEINVIDSLNQTIRFSFVNQTFLDIYKAVCNAARNSKEFNPDNRVIWKVSNPAYYLKPADDAYYDQWALRNLFCVEFVISLKKDHVFSILMKGLNNYFSKELGISACVNNEPRKCLFLQAPGKHTLEASGKGEKNMIFNEENQSYQFCNYPFSEIYQLYFAHVGASSYLGIPPKGRQEILLNETGIEGNVNLQFKALPDGNRDGMLVSLNNSLKDSGLRVVMGVRNLAMLIISDCVN